MKIKKVKWQSHPILGNLELDFCDPNTGEPFNNIIIAGENGTGKTTILETISTFLNKGSFEYFEYIEYKSQEQDLKAVPPTSSDLVGAYDIIDASGERTRMHTNKNNMNATVDNNPLNIRFDGCIISKARADFKTNKITSTMTSLLDTDKYDTDQKDDFTSLKQLLVDIQNQDNSDYAQLNRSLGSTPKSWELFYPDSKIFRFKNSFDNFFNNLKYDEVADEGQSKEIYFLKNGNKVSIDNLSTGEKQIVFRGCYLLKNNKNLEKAAIMIDEPELSMHPKWEVKVLKYYKDLFSHNDLQSAQLFFASHSDHVLKKALQNNNTDLVVVLTENNGVITSKKITCPHVLPSITAAETNYLAFDLPSSDYHIELYGWLQNKESKNTVKSCDDFIKTHQLYNSALHQKQSSNPHGTTYDTLTTYIRNAIDHPDPSRTYSEEELKTSIELLIELCR